MAKKLAVFVLLVLAVSGILLMGSLSRKAQVEDASSSHDTLVLRLQTQTEGTERAEDYDQLPTHDATEKTLVIGDWLFATQLDHIYWNPTEYEGMTIQYEGIYYERAEPDPATGEVTRMVYRNTNGGCCGNDGIAGIEMITNLDQLPQNGDWVQVTCYIDWVNFGDPYSVVRLNATEFKVLEERGAEFVPN